MEDCVVLDHLLEECEGDFTRVLSMYSEYRNPDAEAIVDLAMYNYVEVKWVYFIRYLIISNSMFARRSREAVCLLNSNGIQFIILYMSIRKLLIL